MPSSTIVPLKYFFCVHYNDGTCLIQNQEDVSKTDPTKSAYYDVEQDKIKYFELLIGREQSIGISLDTGKFFTVCEGYYRTDWNVNEVGPKPYKLIFYRQHTHNFNIEYEELSHTVKYCIGYTDANGIEHKIYID